MHLVSDLLNIHHDVIMKANMNLTLITCKIVILCAINKYCAVWDLNHPSISKSTQLHQNSVDEQGSPFRLKVWLNIFILIKIRLTRLSQSVPQTPFHTLACEKENQQNPYNFIIAPNLWQTLQMNVWMP
jgi:hypothetical protein